MHERLLTKEPGTVGTLLDSLSSPHDRLWPRAAWPAMRFDRPLGVGAEGGHGPIRYSVESHTPGKQVRFRFTGSSGLDGTHGFELIPRGESATLLRHTVNINTRGLGLLSWPLVIGPLHDALMEDCLTTAQSALSIEPKITPWTLWVRVLRRLFAGKKARPQGIRPESDEIRVYGC